MTFYVEKSVASIFWTLSVPSCCSRVYFPLWAPGKFGFAEILVCAGTKSFGRIILGSGAVLPLCDIFAIKLRQRYLKLYSPFLIPSLFRHASSQIVIEQFEVAYFPENFSEISRTIWFHSIGNERVSFVLLHSPRRWNSRILSSINNPIFFKRYIVTCDLYNICIYTVLVILNEKRPRFLLGTNAISRIEINEAKNLISLPNIEVFASSKKDFYGYWIDFGYANSGTLCTRMYSAPNFNLIGVWVFEIQVDQLEKCRNEINGCNLTAYRLKYIEG